MASAQVVETSVTVVVAVTDSDRTTKVVATLVTVVVTAVINGDRTTQVVQKLVTVVAPVVVTVTSPTVTDGTTFTLQNYTHLDNHTRQQGSQFNFQQPLLTHCLPVTFAAKVVLLYLYLVNNLILKCTLHLLTTPVTGVMGYRFKWEPWTNNNWYMYLSDHFVIKWSSSCEKNR